MLVKDLKRFLETCPDDATVVTEGFDHSLQDVSAELTEAVEWREGQFAPFGGESYGEPYPVVKVVLIV